MYKLLGPDFRHFHCWVHFLQWTCSLHYRFWINGILSDCKKFLAATLFKANLFVQLFDLFNLGKKFVWWQFFHVLLIYFEFAFAFVTFWWGLATEWNVIKLDLLKSFEISLEILAKLDVGLCFFGHFSDFDCVHGHLFIYAFESILERSLHTFLNRYQVFL